MTERPRIGAEDVARARSFLFVPGNRPDRFEKAARAGADVIVLDLEDAVPEAEKCAALNDVSSWLRCGNQAAVRVNGIGTAWHGQEIAELGQLAAAILVPKVDGAESLERVAGELSAGVAIVPLIESARGVGEVLAIGEVPGVTRMALGHVDLGSELGVDPAAQHAWLVVRSAMVLASARSGLAPPVDGVCTAIKDTDRVEAESRHVRELGMTAKLCIHPAQVAVVNRVMNPTAQEVAWATSILKGFGTGQDGVTVYDGQMIDAPVLLRATRVVKRAESLGLLDGQNFHL